MAYNVLKGTVEGSVDQHGDQEISGVKVFKSTISASVFYDTDSQSPCATMKDVAITKIKGGRPTSVLTHGGEGTAIASHNMLFDGETLHVKKIVCTNIAGPIPLASQIPANKFLDPIDANFINHGPGLHNVRGTLQTKTGKGLIADETGIGISLSLQGGLSVQSNTLVVDPSKSDAIVASGQNLSDDDLLLVSDTSRGDLRHTTLANLYENHIKLKVPHAAGTTGELQLKGPSGFASSKKLSFNSQANTLNLEGALSTLKLQVEKTLNTQGAVIHSIKTVTELDYHVTDTDYTLLCDSQNGKMNVTLPPACNHTGRILNIKKTNTDKYNLRSHPVTIKVSEGKIDLTDSIVLKMNYAMRTLQSDGTNWWIIGQKGT
tara:strand:- start:799 stop:1926 length:1128 start_codon:yes stop_codon:yes gene_type:complete